MKKRYIFCLIILFSLNSIAQDNQHAERSRVSVKTNDKLDYNFSETHKLIDYKDTTNYIEQLRYNFSEIHSLLIYWVFYQSDSTDKQKIKLKELINENYPIIKEIALTKYKSTLKSEDYKLLKKTISLNDLFIEKNKIVFDSISTFSSYENPNILFIQAMVAEDNDSLRNIISESYSRLNEIIITQKLNKEVEKEKEVTSLKTFQKWSVLFILLVIIIVVIIARNNIIKKKINSELLAKNNIIIHQKQEIIDSVNYAQKIQQAILPDINDLKELFPNSFVLYQPKDIVSGDFYYLQKINDKNLIIAACDCTGHGIPGAFMSLISNNALKKVIEDSEIKEPEKILELVDTTICNTLKQNINYGRDGMDMALLNIELINEKSALVKYAGANRPLWKIKESNNALDFEITEHKANKHAIGGYNSEKQKTFISHTINLEKNDTIYVFSDGFADQFGGENGKKMMTKKFKDYLISIQKNSLPEQKELLKTFFSSWKGSNEQVDDVLIIGIRI